MSDDSSFRRPMEGYPCCGHCGCPQDEWGQGHQNEPCEVAGCPAHAVLPDVCKCCGQVIP